MQMPWFSLVATVAVTLLFSACASRPHDAEEPARAASLEPKPVNLGKHSFKVSTKSAEAQKAFNRGLTLAYSFSHATAEKEFRRAAELDPDLAMAWWGVALVNGPHINFPVVPPEKAKKAWQALGRAQQLALQASPLEQALIRALATRYTDPQPQDRSRLDGNYASAMREVWRLYPQNADVATLFAESMMDLRPWDLWTLDGKPQPGTEEIVSTLESALRLNPKHPGANHYYIHTIEASPHPEKAVPAADRLRGLVPGASHMVHMPSHIYARVGRWDDAASSNFRAMEVDKAFRAANPRPGFYAMYMAHNAHFYSWVAMVQGRSDEAIRYARQMVEEVPQDFLADFSGVADGYMIFVSKALMRFGKWDEILAEPAPATNLPLSRAFWHYARASALTAKNQRDQAEAEQKKFQEAAARVPAGYTFGNNTASNLLAIAARTLQGEIDAKAGRTEPALANLREAVRIEDTLRYDEPPDWIQPVRHTLGAVLLKANKAEEAEAVYREDLKRFPNNGWSLYGLSEALKLQDKDADAAKAEKEFAKAWSRADVKLATTCFCQQ